MQIGRYRFVPPVWGVLVLLAVAGVLCSLGVWQIERGEAKTMMLAQQAEADQIAPTPLGHTLAALHRKADREHAYGHRYTVTGQVDAAHQILLDSQTFDGRVGYRVWTPVTIAGGTRVMVDRGWVALGPGGRGDVPHPGAPTGQATFTGTWRSLPQPGIRLGSGDDVCDAHAWPRVLSYPTIAQIRCQYDQPVADGLLLLAENDARGFARDWHAAIDRMPPIRHYGYAVQWFAMAIAVAVVFVAVNIKRSR